MLHFLAPTGAQGEISNCIALSDVIKLDILYLHRIDITLISHLILIASSNKLNLQRTSQTSLFGSPTVSTICRFAQAKLNGRTILLLFFSLCYPNITQKVFRKSTLKLNSNPSTCSGRIFVNLENQLGLNFDFTET